MWKQPTGMVKDKSPSGLPVWGRTVSPRTHLYREPADDEGHHYDDDHPGDPLLAPDALSAA